MTKVKELEAKVQEHENTLQELQKQLDAIPSRQQHTPIVRQIRWKNTPAEPEELQALTEEEAAFLKQHGKDIEQRTFIFSVNMRRQTAEELSVLKAMIQQLKKKRGVIVTWHQ